MAIFAGIQRALRAVPKRLAARGYARHLGPRLRRDYGASTHYTTGQIEAAVAACRLPLRYISFGYAAFLSEDAFNTRRPEGDYHSLRRLLSGYLRSNVQQAFHPALLNFHAASGDAPSHSGYDATHHG